MRPVDLLCGESASQAWGEAGGVVPAPEPHYSVCLRFFSYLGKAEPPGVRTVGPSGAP